MPCRQLAKLTRSASRAADADINPKLMTIEWGSVSQASPAWNADHRNRPGTRTSPAAGRNEDISRRFGPGQTVLIGRHRSGESVSLVLVRACGQALQTEGCQSLPGPGRAGPRASLAMPASP